MCVYINTHVQIKKTINVYVSIHTSVNELIYIDIYI